MQRLLTITDQRLPFASQVQQLRQQRQWLIDLDHLLSPSSPPDAYALTADGVAQAVRAYLTRLTSQVALGQSKVDHDVAVHMQQTFHNHWWGLFQCYAMPGLPRTNNDLERFLRRLKMGQRRITGRKNVHDFILRYGRCAACIDYDETLTELLARLQKVSQEDFLHQRQALSLVLQREQKQHRFRHHRPTYLSELEARWAAVQPLVL